MGNPPRFWSDFLPKASGAVLVVGALATAPPVSAQSSSWLDAPPPASAAFVERGQQDLYLEVYLGERSTGRIIHVRLRDGGGAGPRRGPAPARSGLAQQRPAR